MSILVDSKTRVVVQGITGRDGSFHTRQMLDYGTKVVAGVTPFKRGAFVEGVPVFDSVDQAVSETGANTSVIYVPPQSAIDAILEGADAGVDLIVCITEGVPANDMTRVYHQLKRTGTRLIGPNCPGVISPGQCKVGIMPGHIHRKGSVGVISRSGTLTYEVVYHLTANGIGQSTCIGIGGDPVIGTNFIDVLQMFERDKGTQAIVLIGEIGGTDEEEAAEFINREMTKPVVAFIAGRTAPPGKRMGHAGAIISGGTGTAAEKVAAFRAAGVEVAVTPAEIAKLVKGELARLGKPQVISVAASPRRKAAKKSTRTAVIGGKRSGKNRPAKKAAKSSKKSKKSTKSAGKSKKSKGGAKKSDKKSVKKPAKKTTRKTSKKTPKRTKKSPKKRPAKKRKR